METLDAEMLNNKNNNHFNVIIVDDPRLVYKIIKNIMYLVRTGAYLKYRSKMSLLLKKLL